MPLVSPFRALRYSPDVVPDLARVVAPPYDVIEPEEHRALLARDPRNVVRLDLPADEPGEEPEERYRRAARLLTAWRSDGTLRRDPRPSLYPYEQTFASPSGRGALTRRGLFATVALEPFGPGAAIRPHERTMAGPREDRYRLLRATGVNTSPVVGMYEEPSGAVAEKLNAVAGQPPLAEVTDEEGTRHRLWTLDDEAAAQLSERIGRSPITIADGHHRYETALRYRDERRTGAAPGSGAAYDRILMLLLEPLAGPILVLATHRVVLGLGSNGVEAFRSRLGELFDVEEATGEDLLAAFGPAVGPGGEGRFGLWTRDGGAILRARREAFEPLALAGGDAVRGLDVTLLGIALEHLAGIDATAVAGGDRLAYTKSATEAIRWVEEERAGEREGADVALLLDPTPASSIIEVAAAGDVMPQKSTYIHPKALTGLVINPLE